MVLLKRFGDGLIDRFVHALRRQAYARDLHWLRRQLRERAWTLRAPGPDVLQSAAQMRALRIAIVAAIGPVKACSGCALGHPLPNGRYAGGYCCGGATEALFPPGEIDALAAGGTRAWQLRAPQGERSGCAFRGPGGCSLSPEHRPNRCVTYLCTDLSRDLAAQGRLDRVEALCSALTRELGRFEALVAAGEAGVLPGPCRGM